MADPNSPIGDEVELEKYGTVRISLAGTHYRWRVPLSGEFIKFKELWMRVADEELKITAKANAATPEPQRTAAWRINHEMQLRPLFLGWVMEVWRALCAKDVPEEAKMPVWASNVHFAMMLFDHWTTVPLVASNH
ncbi:MAG: hypothetical protein ABR532_09005 [Candidatus Dormibacteria bacterium]